MPLRTLQGFIDSIFRLAHVPLSCPHYTCISRRVWRKLHIAVDTSTHEVIAAELSLSTVTDGEVLSNLLKQIRQSILEVSGDGAYSPKEKGQPSGSVVTLEISQWVARNYTAQISIGKSGMDTTNVHSQKPRCVELNSC